MQIRNKAAHRPKDLTQHDQPVSEVYLRSRGMAPAIRIRGCLSAYLRAGLNLPTIHGLQDQLRYLRPSIAAPMDSMFPDLSRESVEHDSRARVAFPIPVADWLQIG